MSSLEMTPHSIATRVGLPTLARAIGIAVLAGAAAWPQAASAVGRTEPAAQMRENPIRGQELRRQLLEHYGLDMVQRERQRTVQPAAVGPDLDGLRGVNDGLPPSDPATIAPTIAPTATPVKVPAIDSVMDPSSALPVSPSTPLADPAARPGGGPLVDRPVASPVATPPLPPMDAATVAPVGKVRLTEDERQLLREQLRRLPRGGTLLRD